jgi:hypothetical protein
VGEFSSKFISKIGFEGPTGFVDGTGIKEAFSFDLK